MNSSTSHCKCSGVMSVKAIFIFIYFFFTWWLISCCWAVVGCQMQAVRAGQENALLTKEKLCKNTGVLRWGQMLETKNENKLLVSEEYFPLEMKTSNFCPSLANCFGYWHFKVSVSNFLPSLALPSDNTSAQFTLWIIIPINLVYWQTRSNIHTYLQRKC